MVQFAFARAHLVSLFPHSLAFRSSYSGAFVLLERLDPLFLFDYGLITASTILERRLVLLKMRSVFPVECIGSESASVNKHSTMYVLGSEDRDEDHKGSDYSNKNTLDLGVPGYSREHAVFHHERLEVPSTS